MELMTDRIPFYCIGISYKNADADTRGTFSLDEGSIHALQLAAKEKGCKEMLLLNTCNRTEIYVWGKEVQTVQHLLCSHSNGSPEVLKEKGYLLNGQQALHHLFRVGTGLESQILGDFEVIGQLKQSFYRAKKMGLINGHFERLVNAVIQASKRIKTETKISTGATSVAFAAVQYILKNVEAISTKKIVLFGTGKIGRNTCENLVKHTQNDHIVLINRTQERATAMAKKFPVQVKPYGQLSSTLRETDLLIVATGAQRPTLTPDMIHINKPLLILDLSMPRNVDFKIGDLDNITLVHLDELSKITNSSIEERKKHLPKAEEILQTVENEFLDWLEHRKFAPTLKAIKEKLLDRSMGENETPVGDDITYMAQKITGHVAAYLKENPKNAAATVALLEEIFQFSSTKP